MHELPKVTEGTSSTPENTTQMVQVLICHPACLPLVPVVLPGHKYGLVNMEVSLNAFPDDTKESVL